MRPEDAETKLMSSVHPPGPIRNILALVSYSSAGSGTTARFLVSHSECMRMGIALIQSSLNSFR